MKVSQRRHKIYHDKRTKALKIGDADHVFLRVTLVIDVGRVLKSRKFTPPFIGPYKILKRVWQVSYRFSLPPLLLNLHTMFNVSQLQKYAPNPSHVI